MNSHSTDINSHPWLLMAINNAKLMQKSARLWQIMVKECQMMPHHGHVRNQIMRRLLDPIPHPTGCPEGPIDNLAES